MESSTDRDTQDDDKMVEEMCKDYSEFLTPKFDKEAKNLDDSIEELLTKLDEYCGLVDIVRSDTSLCLTRTLPAIHAKTLQMQELFDKVDRLEVFVGMVKTHITTMEALLDQAETEMGASSVKKLLSSISLPFFGKKTQPKVVRQLTKYTPPNVFKTEDYFPKIKETSKPEEDCATKLEERKDQNLEEGESQKADEGTGQSSQET